MGQNENLRASATASLIEQSGELSFRKPAFLRNDQDLLGNLNGGLEDTDAYERQWAERSEEHTSELQSLMRISYAVFCLKKKKKTQTTKNIANTPEKQEDAQIKRNELHTKKST